MPKTKIEYQEITRKDLIEKLIDDDLDTISSGDASDYIYNILKSGFDGYDTFSNKLLIQEYYERLDPDFMKPKIKIIKKKKGK